MKGSKKPKEELPPREQWLAVGERLEMSRNILGLNQRAFLEGTGVSEAHYSGVKKGAKGLSLEKALGFVEAHDLSLDWILLGKIGMDLHMMRSLQAVMNSRQNRKKSTEEVDNLPSPPPLPKQ